MRREICIENHIRATGTPAWTDAHCSPVAFLNQFDQASQGPPVVLHVGGACVRVLATRRFDARAVAAGDRNESCNRFWLDAATALSDSQTWCQSSPHHWYLQSCGDCSSHRCACVHSVAEIKRGKNRGTIKSVANTHSRGKQKNRSTLTH